jgi:hypothetical protein
MWVSSAAASDHDDQPGAESASTNDIQHQQAPLGD